MGFWRRPPYLFIRCPLFQQMIFLDEYNRHLLLLLKLYLLLIKNFNYQKKEQVQSDEKRKIKKKKLFSRQFSFSWPHTQHTPLFTPLYPLLTYYFDQKVSGFYSKIQKYKFIHQNRYCPIQSTPHRLQRQRLIQSSKHFLYSVFGFAIRAVFDYFFHYLLVAAKTRSPRRFFGSTEQQEVAGRQISWIRWLLDAIRSVNKNFC